MKFAIAALIACASAIKIQSSTKKSCVTKEMANRGFDDLDTNGNGSLDYDEIKTGIQDLADQMDFTPTEEDWAWVIATGTAIDKKTPGKVDRREFRKFARAVFKHFGLCAMIEEHEEEHSLITQDADTQGPPPAGGCVDHEMAMEGFHHLDTDHSGSLDYGEIQVGIEDLAKMGDYTPTTADWNWIKTTGAAIDTKNPGSVDEEEFYTFSNDVFNHFGICAQMHLPREGDSGDSGDHHGPMPPMDHGDHHDTTGPMPPMDHGDHHDTTGPMPPMDHGDHHDTTGPATVEPMATTA